MRKNSIFGLFAVVLVLTMVSASLVSGTLAKYTKEVTATDTARVALFDFEINDVNDSAFDEIDLFTYVDDNVDVDGPDDDEKVIAPGTTGTLTIKIDNLSEVAVLPSVELSAVNAGGIPLTFTYGATDYTDLALLEAALNDDLDKLDFLTGTQTLSVDWEWVFYDDDAQDILDTALGEGGTATYALTVAVTVTQVD